MKWMNAAVHVDFTATGSTLLPISITFVAFISFARLAINWDCSQATIMALEECSMVLWRRDCETEHRWADFFFFLDQSRAVLQDLESSPVWGLWGLDAPSRSEWGRTASAGRSHGDFWWCSFWKVSFSLRANMKQDANTITKNRMRWVSDHPPNGLMESLSKR